MQKKALSGLLRLRLGLVFGTKLEALPISGNNFTKQRRAVTSRKRLLRHVTDGMQHDANKLVTNA
uniref:Uncharacterized protein n=1 Tax=mine drainage metagenome TaxID=410659 RepID=E6QIR3_9ZZZZ